MVNWKPIEDFILHQGEDRSKDCGEGTLQSVSVCYYSAYVEGWVFSDKPYSTYKIHESGYRPTHFAEIENLP